MMSTRFAAMLLILIGIAALPVAVSAQDVTENVTSGDVEVTSGGQAYQDIAQDAFSEMVDFFGRKLA